MGLNDNSTLGYETKESKIYGIDEKGEFTGTASVYGVKDLVDDVVAKGAFTRTIKNHNNVVTLLWQHHPDVPIGLGELADSEKGLEIKGKINLEVQAGKEAYELLKQKAVKGLSIGYDPIDWEYKDGSRVLKEIRLWEVSLVTFPANPQALVADVKSRMANDAENAIKMLESIPKPLDAAYAERLQSLLATTPPSTEAEAKAESDNSVESDSELIHSLMELYQEMKK